MGFRSTMITDHAQYGWMMPDWFKEKYPWLNSEQFPLSSKTEVKFYANVSKQEVFVDMQKILRERENPPKDIIVVLVHECGGITRVKITKDSITAKIPLEWLDVEDTGHYYCYGCSDDKPIETDLSETTSN